VEIGYGSGFIRVIGTATSTWLVMLEFYQISGKLSRIDSVRCKRSTELLEDRNALFNGQRCDRFLSFPSLSA